jgi:hypothetical protein
MIDKEIAEKGHFWIETDSHKGISQCRSVSI